MEDCICSVITYEDEPEEYGVKVGIVHEKNSVKIKFPSFTVRLIFKDDILTATVRHVGDYNIKCIYHGERYSVVSVRVHNYGKSTFIIIYDSVTKKCSFIEISLTVIDVCFYSDKLVINTNGGVDIYDMKGKLLARDVDIYNGHHSMTFSRIYYYCNNLYTIIKVFDDLYVCKTQINFENFSVEQSQPSGDKDKFYLINPDAKHPCVGNVSYYLAVKIGSTFVFVLDKYTIDSESYEYLGRFRANVGDDVYVKTETELICVTATGENYVVSGASDDCTRRV